MFVRGIKIQDRCCSNIPAPSSMQAGSSRVLYDLLPVVSFRGWPAVAQGWLTANHFWDGKITEEEAISGFYLLPCCSPLGGRPDREWRLAFSRSEVRGIVNGTFVSVSCLVTPCVSLKQRFHLVLFLCQFSGY